MGRIDEFDGSKEEWTQYVERLDHFFIANGITDGDRKKSAFIAVIGPTTYTLLRNLVSPEKSGDKSYEQLATTLKNHYNPTPSETVQRSKFNSRFRRPGESVATFVSELRSLAEFCNFGASLDDLLRDRIVCGINHGKIQQRLLAEKTLTLARAIELAQGMETAEKNAKELPQNDIPSAEKVNRGAQGKNGKRKFEGTCFCCGKSGHKRNDCRLKNVVFPGCGKTGHVVRVCRNKQPPKKRVHHVQDSGEDSEDEVSDLYVINSSSKSQPYKTSIMINDQSVCVEIDTGASLLLMSENTKKSWPKLKLSPTKTSLHSYSGELIPVVGTVDVNVQCGEQKATLPLIVVQGEGPSLLGRNWMSEL